ncbi:MAG: c-type cytochrome [Gemmatimonadaceae bacterium]
MTRFRETLGHPFWQAILLVVGSYLLIKFGIAYIPPIFGVRSAPVPSSVVVQFMFIAIAGILIHVSSDEPRWRRFKEPISETLVRSDRRPVRIALLILVPLLAGFATYEQTRPRVEAPSQLRAIHPAPPGEITFRGKRMALTGLANPLRASGSLDQHIAEGRRVYYQNCLACHGDRLDGAGHFSHGFSPTPLSFADQGTIAQLSESFVFWRIAKGGPGLPREGAPWNSAMPVWEDFLTENEIWAVITFLYAQSGWQPRAEIVHGAEQP